MIQAIPYHILSEKSISNVDMILRGDFDSFACATYIKIISDFISES